MDVLYNCVEAPPGPPSLIHADRVVGQHRKGIFLAWLRSPLEKQPIHALTVALLQDVSVGAQLAFVGCQNLGAALWPQGNLGV